MVYTIFHNGTEINRIEGTIAFVDAYCARNGYTYKETPFPEPRPNLEEVRVEKIAQMSAACNAAIVGGVDVELSDGITYHYSLTLEDQLNMMNIQAMVASGAEFVPYHADGEECRYYSAADFSAIAEAATAWKLYQESYFNSLRSYIQTMTTVEDIEAVTYGMSIPEEFQSDVLKNLTGGAE